MKPLLGNLDFSLIRASRGPFSLKHKTQGHVKLGGNFASSFFTLRQEMGYGEISVKSNVLNERVSLKENSVCLREETVPSL